MKHLLIAVLLSGPAAAAELRELCPERPGLGTPPCIVDRGHLQFETGVADYQRDRTVDTDTQTWRAGEGVLRYGVTDSLEVAAGWTAYTDIRTRDRASGEAQRARGVGDLRLGLKQSLANPDGKGVSVALLPFVTAPTATGGVGASGWTQGLIVPVSVDLPGDFSFELAPEIDRLPNTQQRGHHAAYTGVIGLARSFGAVELQAEFYASRDDDPGARTTQAIADLNLGWTMGDNLALDAEVDAGLNADTPDLRIAIGLSRRF